MENQKVILRKASRSTQELLPPVRVVHQEAKAPGRDGVETKLRADVQEWLKKRRAA